MNKEFAKYMTYGLKVEDISSGTKYKLIEKMSADKDTVRAVALDNVQRYELLKAWSHNQVGVTPEEQAEMEKYEVAVCIDSVTPIDKLRFITPDYKTKFEVTNLDKVLVNGKENIVVYMDEYHFTFAGNGLHLWGGCFHICQFAELCEKNGIDVAPLNN